MSIRPWLWQSHGLTSSDMHPDPMIQFERWFKRAQSSTWLEFPEAMTLSTVSPDGWPGGRQVLMKDYDEKGIVFYTNSGSRKGQSLEATPKAGLTFYWEPLHRQIRVEGTVKKLTAKEADEYFATRPRLSKIGAWASKQSEVLDNRVQFENRIKEFEAKYQGMTIPRPEYWNGYRITPVRIEFWQMRKGRLHDRFLFTREEANTWRMRRLYP